jgi:microcystin-dependent protein
MATPFIGQISMFGGNFAPRSWAFCNGQIQTIAQNTALFSILGTTYGGNGQTTFALPDLRGRVPIHPGQGPGLSNYSLGQQGGTETVTLITQQIPAHNHSLVGNNTAANDNLPNGNALADSAIYTNAAPNAQMNAASIGNTGGNQPHPNIQPYLCINFIIALSGIFPSRN